MKISNAKQKRSVINSKKSVSLINCKNNRKRKGNRNRKMFAGDASEPCIDISSVKLGFIGFGFMAQNLCRGFIDKKVLKPSQVAFYDVNTGLLGKSLETFHEVQCLPSNSDLVHWSDVVVLAVKPNVALKALTDIRPRVDVKRHLFISICAGITIRQLEDCLPEKTRVIRSMPNSPAAVGCGVTVICKGRWTNDDDPKIACMLFESVGLCLTLPEKDLNTVTAISGSGPAYVYMSIEAAGDGGSMMGLPRDVAQKLAAWTLMGAAKMYLETGQHPAALKDSVCSPGGTTLAGLRTLENGALRGLIMDTIEKAHDKAIQLEEDAKKGETSKC